MQNAREGVTIKQKIVALFCAIVLVFGCITPIHAETEAFFVSLNDTLLQLNDSTIPIWWNGDLYAPVNVLNQYVTGISVGVNASYNESAQEVSVIGDRKTLIFEMEKGTCYNPKTGDVYNISALNMNGRVYIPIYVVCNFFGLNTNLYSTEYGRLLRITNGSSVWSGESFIESASWMMSSRLKEYNQSRLPPPTVPDVEEPEVPEPEPDIPLYFGVRCDGGTATRSIFSILAVRNDKAVFFFTPEQIGVEGDLIRMLLSSGHSIGILAEGADLDATNALIREGCDQLARVAYTSTTIVFAPEEQRETLAEDGWVVWDETASLVPPAEEDTDSYRYATAIVRALQRLQGGVYLTIDNSEEFAEVFPSSIVQLEGRTFSPTVPLESRL